MNLDEFWVLVDRYPEPNKAWGLHHFIKVESPEADGFQGMYCRPFDWRPGAVASSIGKRGKGPVYRKTTVGLFSPVSVKYRLGELHRVTPGLASMPVPEEIREYVYYQVAPIEWHGELAKGVQEVCDWLTVLAIRSHPAPVSAFTGQASQ